MKYDAIVVASGKGKRAKLGYNKVFFMMSNKRTVLENACHNFIEDKDCQKIIVVTNDSDKVFLNPKVEIVAGGKERFNSVENGLAKVNSEYVLIHDGARPYLSKRDLNNLKKALKTNKGAILASKAIDTIKYVEKGFIKKTINRENIYMAQTPQGFNTKLIKQAFKKVDLKDCTDDAAVFEKAHHKVAIVEALDNNKKLTTEVDFK